MTQGAGQGYGPGSGYEPAPGYAAAPGTDPELRAEPAFTSDPAFHAGPGFDAGYHSPHPASGYGSRPYETGPGYEAARGHEAGAGYEAARGREAGPGYDAGYESAPGYPTGHAAASAPAYEPTRPDAPLVPQDYTPTARDLPVIPPPHDGGDRPGPLYVVGDVHGYLDELLSALRAGGLVDSEGHWSAGSARLWFLGDFTDRGPDGVGVIELVMQLSAEAAAAGGYCRALMGNHELLLLGAHRFGDTPVNSVGGTASFLAAWRLNGGQPSDMERLEDRHLTWISRLDAAHLTDGHLLVHSDTTAYLDYGSSIEEMNDAVTGVLQRGDADECWDLFRKFTKRFAFKGEGGPAAARELLGTYGGRRVVHGHSPIPYLLGEAGGEAAVDGEERGYVIEGPMVYAEDLAVAMDGGVTMNGRLLVAQLPLVAAG